MSFDHQKPFKIFASDCLTVLTDVIPNSCRNKPHTIIFIFLEYGILMEGCKHQVLEAIKELLNEATFECTSNGIQLQAMDSSHVSLISLFLSQGGFDKYKCDRNISLGINLSSILKIMKCAGNDDILTIKTQEELDRITFIFESQNYDKVSNYQLRLMNLDHEHLEVPETDYACVMKMPSAEFARIFKMLLQFGETVLISCSKEGVKFSTSGDLGSANIKLAPNNTTDSDKAVHIEIQEPVSATFALRYLTSFAKATPVALRVQLSLTSELPLLVEYELGDKGRLKYYLAPKVDD